MAASRASDPDHSEGCLYRGQTSAPVSLAVPTGERFAKKILKKREKEHHDPAPFQHQLTAKVTERPGAGAASTQSWQ